MDVGSVNQTVSADAGSWKLDPVIAAQTQGLVVCGFGTLPQGRALLLNIGATDPTAANRGAWLTTLEQIAAVTSAQPMEGNASQATALAFTWTGLQVMGLSEPSLASFLPPFREGMMQEDRLRRLGDRRKGEWQQTVIKGGPVWSANVPQSAAMAPKAGAYDVTRFFSETAFGGGDIVHAILLLYTPDEAAAAALVKRVEAALLPHDVKVVRRIDLSLQVEKSGVANEHFGFADGLSQPLPFDASKAVLQNGQPVTSPDPIHGVPLGDFLLGYDNGHHEIPPGPVVAGDEGRKVDRPTAAGLAPHPKAMGFFDFGLNGSYLVVRELKQDVAAFWQSMDENAKTITSRDPDSSAHVTADWLAERVIGRNRKGQVLCPAGPMALDPTGQPDSNYLFRANDPHGYGCPLGSHVRRANPRDSLAPTPDQGPTLLHSANNHRIMRRGRKYGPPIADPRVDDGVDRGLLFMCLNTDIARQFEFVQTTWLLNSSFATLFEEVDPLVGPDGPMTLPEDPLRRMIHVKTFVQMVGGDYFFLPSLPALRYLALL
jgi:deferrochelatase/peroxidase EfeB